MDWTAAISHMPTIRRNVKISRGRNLDSIRSRDKRFATTNLPCVQRSDSEFCPYSGDVGDLFSANLDSSEFS